MDHPHPQSFPLQGIADEVNNQLHVSKLESHHEALFLYFLRSNIKCFFWVATVPYETKFSLDLTLYAV